MPTRSITWKSGDEPSVVPPDDAGRRLVTIDADRLDQLQRIHDAWMQQRDPVVIYDRDIRLVDFNQSFADLHRDADGHSILRHGMSFAEIADWRRETNFYAGSPEERDPAPDRHGRIADYDDTRFVHRLKDGRVFLVDRYELADRSRLGVWIDITAVQRGEEERRALEKQLMHAQRLKALGTLAGGIAHELNNTLVPVLALAKMTAKRLSPGSREQRNVETILRAGERARDLVSEMLVFSRKHEQVRRDFDLADVARAALHMLRASLSKTIQLDQHIDPVPPITGDPAQIHQVIVNLVNNAAHAIGQRRGKITLTVAVAPEGVAPPDNGPAVPAVRLSVADTGCGMDAATLAQIFEPFFTTKSVGEGTGLGLSIAHGVVTAHHGRITVESTPGRGTEFCVLLPIAATQVEA